MPLLPSPALISPTTVFVSWLVSVLALFSCPVSASAQVVINELMYHPIEEPEFHEDGTPVLELYEDIHEFIELHNAGSVALDLERWELVDGIRFTFPDDTTLEPGGFLVVAKDPDRLAGIAEYGLERGGVFGPYSGQLSNRGERVALVNAEGALVDEVPYGDSAPWAVAADALGAGPEWTGIDPLAHQHRGRSLERVSAAHGGSDPANWLASPMPGEPSPGRPNTVVLPEPLPIALAVSAVPAESNDLLIRATDNVRVTCIFSTGRIGDLADVAVEYFADDIDSEDEPRQREPMLATMDAGDLRFEAILPIRRNRTLVRYRIRADRGRGDEVVSPRADDPRAWHAWFVTPERDSGHETYDMFISRAAIRQLAANLAANPRAGYRPAFDVEPNGPWNDTVPGVLVHQGVVRDVQLRYNGSFFRRNPGRQSYKVSLPDYAPLNGQDTLLITDKDWHTSAGHMLYDAAGLPSSETQTVELYVNDGPRLLRIEIEEPDGNMLERYHLEQAELIGAAEPEPTGQLFKSSGLLEDRGPYGRGDGGPLLENEGWSPLRRYGWTYSSKSQDWRGFRPLQTVIEDLAATRTAAQTVGDELLRAHLLEHWDVDTTLTQLAIRNWSGVRDDTVHNYFIWQRRNGRWAMLPWDFDSDFSDTGGDIFRGASFSLTGTHGLQHFKDSFFRAFPQEYKERMFLLNNQFLTPENLTSLGAHSSLVAFARLRQSVVNRQLGDLQQPRQPVNLTMKDGVNALPPAEFHSSAFAHLIEQPPPHQSTRWEIRERYGTWQKPVFRLDGRIHLTSLPVPFELLTPETVYYWRCTHEDAEGATSFASGETAFVYGANGGNAARRQLIGLDPDTAWRYDQSGENRRGTFARPDFDDSAWPEGPALLGDSPARLDTSIRTPLQLGKLTYYFRHTFQFDGNPGVADLMMHHYVDDGAVFYLNGTEVYRINMGTRRGISALSRAIVTVEDAEQEGPILLPTGSLVRGRNVFAVEVHQDITTSPDLVFGASLAADFAPHPSGLHLNEIMAVNRAAVRNGDLFPDWIELHNASDSSASLDGLFLSDDPEVPDKFEFPAGANVPPGGFLVVWCDDAVATPGIHTGFALDGNGETILLSRRIDGGMARVDSLSFGIQIADFSVGRVRGTADTWELNQPTPGQANRSQPRAARTALRLNEWMASASDNQDWIELFNTAPIPVDLSKMLLSDDPADPDRMSIANLSLIGPRSFQAFASSTSDPPGRNRLGFRLNASGETIVLATPDEFPVDRVTFGAQTLDVSEGRFPDGSGQFRFFAADNATRGEANQPDRDRDGIPDDWESVHDLDPGDPADARIDSDGDGQDNLDEFLAGTDPRDSESHLAIESVHAFGDEIRFRFKTLPGRRYRVEVREPGFGAPWLTVKRVEPAGEAGVAEVGDRPAVGSTQTVRFYRLVVE